MSGNACHYVRQPGLPRWVWSFVSSGVDHEKVLQRTRTLYGRNKLMESGIASFWASDWAFTGLDNSLKLTMVQLEIFNIRPM